MDDEEVRISEPTVPLIDLCAQNGDNVTANEDACAASDLEATSKRYPCQNKQIPARKGKKHDQKGDNKTMNPASGEKDRPIRKPRKHKGKIRLRRISGKAGRHRARKMTKVERREVTLFGSLYRNISLSSRGKRTYSMALVELHARVD